VVIVFEKWGVWGEVFMQINNHLAGFQRHLRVLHALSEQSIQQYQRAVEECLRWLDGKGIHDIKDITRKDLEAYLEWCFYRGNSTRTRMVKLISLQRFFRYLKYEEIIERDIASEIPRPKIYQKFAQKFTKDEVLKIFRAIDINTEKGIRDVCIFIFAAFCGMRIGEISKVRMEDVIDGKPLYINVIDSKFHSYRSVSIWKATAVFINQWYSIRLAQGANSEDPFFISFRRRGWRKFTNTPQEKPLGSAAIGLLIKAYAKKAGLRRSAVRAHMFRATHYDDLRHIKGYDDQAIAGRLGWKHTSTADRYISNRDRVSGHYPSLAAYWSEFPNIWRKNDNNGDGIAKED